MVSVSDRGNYYRPPVKEDLVDKPIWQQMPIEHFYWLLREKKLYLKSIKDYGEEFERGLLDLYGMWVGDTKLVDWEQFKSVSEMSSKASYLSCWYGSDHLAKRVFDDFTKGRGVAIKTTIGKLLSALDCEDNREIKSNCRYGEVTYTDDDEAEKNKGSVVGDRVKFDAHLPYFLKKIEYKDECEFRLLVSDTPAMGNDEEIFMPIKMKNYISIIPEELIDYVAVSKETNGNKNFMDMLSCLCGSQGYSVKEGKSENKFVQYKFEHEKGGGLL